MASGSDSESTGLFVNLSLVLVTRAFTNANGTRNRWPLRSHTVGDATFSTL
jgi:hypothetical protein